jgi:S-methylmethionine-dependent homocysteine/selenocysteine methylase
VLDGGTGSEIQARGVPMDGEAWSALANVTHPGVVRAVHEDYIRAGAQVVIANTFAAGPGALAAAGAGERFEEVNEAAVRLACEARERAGIEGVSVAGSLSLMAHHGLEEDRSDARDRIADAYRAQADVLAAAGADLLLLEMMCEAEHALPALAAAAATGLRVWLGVSAVVPAEGGPVETVRGVDLGAFLDEVLAQGVQPDAVLVMHTDLDDVAPALDVVASRFDGPTGAYPHRGTWTPPEWTFAEIAPDEFAARVSALRDRGATLLGGCCGIRPAHVAALATALQDA